MIRLIGEAAGGGPVTQGLAETGDSFGLLAGVGAGPAAEDSAAGEPEREAMLGSDRGPGFRANASAAAVPAKLVEHGGKIERQRLAARRQRVAQAHGLAAEPPRFIGVAEQPQGNGTERLTGDAGVLTELRGVPTMALGVVES